jgi:hypothetical protein
LIFGFEGPAGGGGAANIIMGGGGAPGANGTPGAGKIQLIS